MNEDGPRGWYGPPTSRRWHFIGPDSRSLCRKWLVPAWSDELIDRAYGPANGDCASCKAKLEASTAAAAAEATP